MCMTHGVMSSWIYRPISAYRAAPQMGRAEAKHELPMSLFYLETPRQCTALFLEDNP